MRSSFSSTSGSNPFRLSAPAAARPEAPAPTTTTRASGERMKRPQNQEECGQDHVKDDRNRTAEPTLGGAAGHAHGVAHHHRDRVQGAEDDQPRPDRLAWLGKEPP